MSDLQCAARFLLARPGLDADVLERISAEEHVVRTVDGRDADLAALADSHRGETVLVIESDGSRLGVHLDGGWDLVLAEIDADGWRVTDLSAHARLG